MCRKTKGLAVRWYLAEILYMPRMQAAAMNTLRLSWHHAINLLLHRLCELGVELELVSGIT
jgi:hypothetical protein